MKTCQLCGRPLSRIRVGGDPDFCSREHRNQYRLRAGMDRLLEANKVASLMRRRETARQIPVALLFSAPAMESRSGAVISPFQSSRAPDGLPASRAIAIRPGFPEPEWKLQAAANRWLPAPARSAEAPAFPMPKLGISTVLTVRQQAHIAALRAAEAKIAKAERPLVVPPPEPRDSRRGFQTEAGTDARQLTSLARRIPVQRIGQDWSAERTRGRRLSLRPLGVDAHKRTAAVRAPAHPLRVPGYRVRLKINRLNPYPPLTLPAPKSIPDASRVSGSFWQIGNRACATGLRSSSPATVLFRARATLDLRLELAKEADSSRLAEVCFAPAVPGLSHPLGALHRFRPITRIETSPQAPIAVEEHFASGLALWTGETADWTSDAAGARPAGLGLFEPSLGLADYQFEFLTRIEKEGVTFVIRALNPGNHHRITIRRSSSGDWELIRCVTIGGVEEDVVTVPMNTPPRTSAFTVMAQARRNDLSVLVDGEPVARWTDGRLPRGGAGFLSLRNHQARIYSVRLTHLGAHITAPGSKISLRSKQ